MMKTTIHLAGSLVLATLALTGTIPGRSAAQEALSSDQIIKLLRPQNGMQDVTRGIRPLSPAAAPSISQPMRRPPGHGLSSNPSVTLGVQFASGSADLTPGATRTLDELGRALTSDALISSHFRIEGHTDTVGTPQQNRSLSARRAMTVADYLSDKFNVDRSRMVTVGMGEEGLMVITPPQTPDIRNRRVEVVNLDG